jgi:hypothetical protein
MKSESETAEILAEFEDQCGAYELTVRGISVWRLIRAPVGYVLQDLPFSVPPLPLVDLFAASVRSMWDIWRLSPQDVRYVVKSYASALRVNGVHGFEDVYFEQLLRKEPGGVWLGSLNAAGKGRKYPVATASLDCTLIPILGVITARILPLREGAEVFTRLSKELQGRLGVSEFSAQRISHMFSSFWWQSRLFEWLLVRLAPQAVITADSGERAVIAACRRRGIRLVEMQHGVFTPHDPDCLPAVALQIADEKMLLLPDALALYGDYWVARHKNTAMGQAGRLHAVGAAIIDRYREIRGSQFRSDPAFPRLVVTSQGLDRDALIRFLADFLKRYSAPCVLCVKLHPAYDLSLHPYTRTLGADPRVQIFSGSEEPNTFELIASADLHLSIASACHFDALGIGCPTAVLGLAGHEVVFDLAETGNALFADTPADLAAMVQGRCWTRLAGVTPENFFRSGFVENMSELIA